MARTIICVLSLMALPILLGACDPTQPGDSIIGQRIEVGPSDTYRLHAMFPCGDVGVRALTIKKTQPIGSFTISNDKFNIYVDFDSVGDWVMGHTRVHVGFNEATDVPRNGDDLPKHSLFMSRNARNVPMVPAVVHDEHAIPLTDLGSPSCETTVVIWGWVLSFRLDTNNNELEKRGGWGGQNLVSLSSGRWYFYAEYTLQCCENGGGLVGEFRTQSQGGYGTNCHGNNPGCYRDEMFDSAFPDGLTIGIGCLDGHTMTFTNSAAIANFLPSGGKPGPLANDYVDPVGTTEAGVLASQVLALALNLGFDAADPDFGASSASLADDMMVCNTGTPCDGLTLQQLLDEGNLVLSGCPGVLGVSPADLNDCLTMVNENFTDGEVDLGFVCPI